MRNTQRIKDNQKKDLIVLGNGPSLSDVDFNKLNKYDTFGLNKISATFDETDWRPDYYLFQGKKNEEYPEYAQKAIDEGCITFIESDRRSRYGDNDNICYFDLVYKRPEEVFEKAGISSYEEKEDADYNKILEDLWSNNINDCVYSYFNSMIPLCQIASYLGYTTMYFVGCDGYKKYKPFMIFDEGEDPSNFPNLNGNLVQRYKNFLLESDTPFRSTVNGIAWKLFRIKLLSKIYYVCSKDPNYYKETNYPDKFVRIAANHDFRNSRLELTHNIIEYAGRKCGFKTYNSTPNSQLDIHTNKKIPIF